MACDALLAASSSFLDNPLAKGVGALAGLYVVYRLGLRAYFLQREHEDIRARYLVGGLDLTSAQVDYALGVFRSNWALLLRYAKLCRELKVPFEANDFFVQFRELDQNQFQIAPVHRVNVLARDEIIWNQYQRVFSFVGSANDKMKADFGPALQMLAQNPNHSNKDDIVKTAEDVAKELTEKSGKFYVYLSELNNFSQLLEQTRLRRKDLSSFHKRKEVVGILNRLRAAFPEDSDA